jgi:hypothetical protein
MTMDNQPAARIDRLRLAIPGSSAGHGRKVAELVAAGLANAGALPQAGDLPTLRVTVTADRHCDPATLARHIVAATLRELARIP